MFDWCDWLPPQQLPDTGIKEFRVGQIWGYASGSKNLLRAGVIEIINMHHSKEQRLLASNCYTALPSGILFFPHGRGRHAILIADVNCSPDDPDLLYQFLYK